MASKKMNIQLNPQANRSSIPQELIDRITSIVPPIQGWCTLDKAFHLAEKVVETKPQVAVEIGIFEGKSMIPIALAMAFNKLGVVNGIDPWAKADAVVGEAGGAAHENWWANIDFEALATNTINHIANNALSEYCRILRMKSQDAVKLFKDGTIDFLHIDGNHSETSSCSDVIMWLPKVKIGGIIFFDDIDWSSTSKASELLGQWCGEISKHGTYGTTIKTKDLPCQSQPVNVEIVTPIVPPEEPNQSAPPNPTPPSNEPS